MKLLKLLAVPAFAAVVLLSGCKQSVQNVSIKTEADSMSFALGVNIAASMKQSDMKDVNVMAVAKGIEAALSEKEGVMTNEEAIQFLNSYFTKERERVAAENLEAGTKFLEENATKEGVVVDTTGIQYKVLVEGEGAKPSATDKVRVHYHGTRIDGSVFDSSVERGEPFETKLNQVIKGWTIGVQKMSVGSKYIFYIPSNLAYGANPRPGGPVKPNDVLIFEVELLDIIEE
jgi:FKBP-type peptidyl-prolyl cis-trans isomerase